MVADVRIVFSNFRMASTLRVLAGIVDIIDLSVPDNVFSLYQLLVVQPSISRLRVIIGQFFLHVCWHIHAYAFCLTTSVRAYYAP